MNGANKARKELSSENLEENIAYQYAKFEMFFIVKVIQLKC